MKRNEGFTLIELLAVIVILAIIALIAMPSVINVIDKANKSAFKDSAYGLIKAGDLYYARQQMNSNVMEEDKVFEFPNGIEGLDFKGNKPIDGYMIINKEGQVQMAIHNGKYCITKGYKDGDVTITEDLENCFISIPITDLSFETRDIIIHRKDQILLTPIIEPSNATDKTLNWEIEDESIAIIEDGLLKAVSVGTTTLTVTTTDGTGISKKLNITIRDIILSDLATTGTFEFSYGTSPVSVNEVDECAKSEKICEPGTAFAIKVNNADIYKFYVINDDGNEVTLIMDRNLVDNVAWYKTYDSNLNGPVNALNYLNDQTSDWNNIPSISSYTYDNNKNGTTHANGYQKLEIVEGKGILTSQDGQLVTEIEGKSKARLLTYEEVTSTIVGCSSTAGSCQSWIYENLSDSNTNEEPKGYWLLTTITTSRSSARRVYYDGKVNFEACSRFTNGIRPVITLSK